MSIKLRFSSIEKWLLHKIRHSIGRAPIRLIVGGGEDSSPSEPAALANVVIRDRRTLAKLVLNPEIGFADAYAEGRIEIEGDLVRLLETLFQSISWAHLESWYSKLMSGWLQLTQANSLRGSRENIRRHYDLRTDFYELWLDSRLVYTCAYFPSPTLTLEQAQLAKLDYVCRKLQLRPGERVVDAGCGWGALAIHMAKHYGVTVSAFNISHEQILFARERAKQEGLSRQVEFIEDDYRNISGRFDAFASIGMLEHVGAEHYKDLGRVIDHVLGGSGRGLLHFIGRNQPRPFSVWTRKRVFPGAYAPALRQVMHVFEPWDFSVLDIENLRQHYAKTLEHWLDRFEKSGQRISDTFGSRFLRTWRLYLAGSLAGFRAGSLQLFQVLFARSGWQQIPWSRAYLYQDENAKEELKWIHATS
jgi:cyclopropane-fatty-acyl-phospholipid synthase